MLKNVCLQRWGGTKSHKAKICRLLFQCRAFHYFPKPWNFTFLPPIWIIKIPSILWKSPFLACSYFALLPYLSNKFGLVSVQNPMWCLSWRNMLISEYTDPSSNFTVSLSLSPRVTKPTTKGKSVFCLSSNSESPPSNEFTVLVHLKVMRGEVIRNIPSDLQKPFFQTTYYISLFWLSLAYSAPLALSSVC